MPPIAVRFVPLRYLRSTYNGSNCASTKRLTDEPNDMFGKIMSIADSLIEEYLDLTTDLLHKYGRTERSVYFYAEKYFRAFPMLLENSAESPIFCSIRTPLEL